MRAMRMFLIFIVAMAAMGADVLQPRTAVSSALSQADNPGVFALTESDWSASGSVAELDDSALEVRFDNGDVAQVRLHSAGYTMFVAYFLAGPLAFSQGEQFVVEQLLPGDAEYIAQYIDIMPDLSDGAVTIRLYRSDNLSSFSPQSSGIVLFAWHHSGSQFSLSIGE